MWYESCIAFFCYKGETVIKELQTNEQIRDREVRLIGADGTQLGVVPVIRAQKMADDEGLDLVKISPTAVPPVCKILDYNKYKYEQSKREKEMKRNQKITEIKEIWLSMTIDENDISIKAKAAAKFLAEGNKVKVSLRMRGRQMAYAGDAVEVVKKFYTRLEDTAKVDKQPVAEGRNITMMLSPIANK